MRLLRRSETGKLSLTKYDGDNVPPYAILSHTWGTGEDEEVSFQDVDDGREKSKGGYAKILFCEQQAAKDELKDFWVDTCCINDKSMPEVSEAINSMFRWYRRASKCYVYLSDVSFRKRDATGEMGHDWMAAFRKSRWFTRGWTLQELLAPQIVEFWSRDGHFLGDRNTLKEVIAGITGVPSTALSGAPLDTFSVNERLRWISKRETKLKEDIAYCLFGIFGVFLVPIYGEGENAFERLRREIGQSPRPCNGPTHVYPYRLIDGHDTTTPSVVDESTRELRRRSILATLSFDQIDARHSSIKSAQRQTCEWFLEEPSYRRWRERADRTEHHGILWIVGKPGAGKSTLMKFAFAHAKRHKAADEIVLSFFFNARGESLERTTLGLYRSLLFQLLSEAPDLEDLLDKVDAQEKDATSSQSWTLDILQNLLSDVVRKLRTRRLALFVDALDECNERQVRGMIEFFEDLEERSIGGDSRVDICFASRHYPTIAIRYGSKLVLEDQPGHADDLRKYIQRRLQAGKGKLVSEIQAEVQQKANGVFMWAVLVVDTLNEEFRRGRIFAVRSRLQEIPTDLSELFRDLLRRDCVNMDELLLCLQWILFARRPLRREEFYFAMVTGLRHHSVPEPSWSPEPWDPEEVTSESMDLFVLNSSKGLAELTKSKKAPTVQFIHESVRDFLIKDNGLRDLWPELKNQMESLSHDKLMKSCLMYLNADTSKYVGPTGELPKASSEEAKRLRQQVSQDFPFHEYASKELLYHANEAAQSNCQKTFLRELDVDKWTHANSLHQIYDIRRRSPHVDILYILAEENCFRLIGALPPVDLWHQCPGERYRYPVVAAFANGHRLALQALLGDPGTAFIDGIVEDPGFGRPCQLRQNQDPLVWAAENGNLSFAECLRIASKDSPLFSTASTGKKYGSALMSASASGRAKVLQMLLDSGAEVNAQGGRYGNALQAASWGGYETVVQMLLDAGAEVNAQGGHYYNALQAASWGGYETVVQMLLDAGAEVNAQGGLFGNALLAASRDGHETVVQMLLNAGGEVNAQGGEYGNALQAASREGHKTVVQMLLDAGAEANAQGGHYGNALQAASWGGYETVVQKLLDAGADVNAQGGPYGNALQAALQGGHKTVVQMLLDAGAQQTDANFT